MREMPAHGTLARGPVGTRFTDGFDVLFLDGDAPAEIVSVSSVGGDEGLRFLGAMIAGPERRLAGWSQLPGYPPTEPGLRQPIGADGATVEPVSQTRKGMGYELLLGYEVIDEGALTARTAVEVVYRVDGKDYLWRSESQLVYCPEAMTGDECFAAAAE